MISRPGPRLFLGLELLAAAIHPDLAIPRRRRSRLSRDLGRRDCGRHRGSAPGCRSRSRSPVLVVGGGIVVAILGALLGVAFGSVSVPFGDTRRDRRRPAARHAPVNR